MFTTIILLASEIESIIVKARNLPSSRELSLAITKLQEASMWCCERARVESKDQERIKQNG